MAYVHMKCGEWRRLVHHVAPFSLFLAASQRKSLSKKRAVERGNDTAARSIDIFRTYVVFFLLQCWHSVKRKKEAGGCNAGKCSCTEGWVGGGEYTGSA